MRLVARSPLAVSKASSVTPFRAAMRLNQSPDRTVYDPPPPALAGAGATEPPPGMTSCWPGRIRLVACRPLAASKASRLTPCREAIRLNQSPDRTVYVLRPEAAGA